MVSLILSGIAALAEAGVLCEIDDSGCVIRIPDAAGDPGWMAGPLADPISAVCLAGEGPEGDAYAVHYAPVADGETAVDIRHCTGVACDRVYTCRLTVRDGAIVEAAGGAWTEAPEPSKFDSTLTGEWETPDGMAAMTIERIPDESAWDVEIVSAAAQGAEVFKATICYDCVLDGFMYDKGMFWDAPITDSDEAPELGEAKLTGTEGLFGFSGDPANPGLSWIDSREPMEIVVFQRAGDAADSGASGLYTQADMDEALAAIDATFSGWSGVELLDIRYAGDGCNTAENIAWLSEMNGKTYAECIEFLMDFHTAADAVGAWEPDADYNDYQWWLAREAGGAWELVSWGY